MVWVHSLFRSFPSLSCLISWLKLLWSCFDPEPFCLIELISSRSFLCLWFCLSNWSRSRFVSGCDIFPAPSLVMWVLCRWWWAVQWPANWTSSGTWLSSLFRHLSSDERKPGPFHHSWLCTRFCSWLGRWAKFIFSSVRWLWVGRGSDLCHSGCVKLFPLLCRVADLVAVDPGHIHILACFCSIFSVIIRWLASLTKVTAPMGSNLGSVIFLRRSTLDFDVSRLAVNSPSCVPPCRLPTVL